MVTMASTGGSSKKDTPSAPATPDYMKLIQEQAKQNRINTKTPYGSSTYTQNADGTWNQVTDIDPRLDNLFGRQIEMAGSGLTDNDYGQYQDIAMAMARRELDPVYDRQWERFDEKMANRGIPVGAEIYSDAYSDLSSAENKAYQDAAFQALQFGSGLRSQDDARTLQDYNMLASVLGNVQAQPVQPIDVMGASQLQQQGAWNKYSKEMDAATQARSNFWNGLGMAGSAAAFSDARLKTRFRFVCNLLGVNFYRWAWNTAAEALGLRGESFGVLAQELAGLHPDLVVDGDATGYLKVNYVGLAQRLGVIA